MFDSVARALKYITDNDIAMVDLKVAGIAGQWLHITIPAKNFTEAHFEEGVGYDGSSGAGFGKVESGDVAALPEVQTGFVDPFFELPTLSFICSTVTADTREPFRSDPRTIAQRAVDYMKNTGIADEAWMGPEFEFNVLDRLNVFNSPYHTQINIECTEVDGDGLTPPIAQKLGYMATPPSDHFSDLRAEAALILQDMGISIRYHHHEVGAPGQCEIEIDLGSLVEVADRAMLIKYVIKNVAHRRGKLATFMPKPIFGEAGNGMHVHQKLTKGSEFIFYDDTQKNYANLSDLALHYVAGLLKHGAAMTAITNPSTNSFKRLVEGYEAPVNLFFSLANRSAAIRVPRYATSPQQKRIEYRPPDFTGNVYLTLATMLMAGIDGILSKVDVAENNFGPFDVDIARQSEEFRSKITPVPRSLLGALDALEADHEFLLKGEVVPESFIAAWIESKRTLHAKAVAVRPHPYEYELYLNV